MTPTRSTRPAYPEETKRIAKFLWANKHRAITASLIADALGTSEPTIYLWNAPRKNMRTRNTKKEAA